MTYYIVAADNPGCSLYYTSAAISHRAALQEAIDKGGYISPRRYLVARPDPELGILDAMEFEVRRPTPELVIENV